MFRCPAGALFLMFLIFVPPGVSAEQLAGPALPPGGKLKVIEKSDLRKYENGKYVGLENREVRGILDWTAGPDGEMMDGTFYVIGELNHGGAPVALKIDEAFRAAWTVSPDGVFEIAPDMPYPLMRGFPVFPARPLAVGDSWKAPGARMVEPLRDGKFTRVKFTCSYRCTGEKTLDGKPFLVVAAKYSLNYKKGSDPAGDERLESISGTHEVSILLFAGDGELSFMNDVMEETCQLAESKSVTYKGFILTWFNGTMPLDRAKTAEKIAADLKGAGVVDVGVEQKKEGVSITLNDIHFVAEQATVLTQEGPRLEAVAQALKQIPSRTFLVIGHTAAVGTTESQQELSVKRAKAIVDFMVSRGVALDRFLYQGRGGTQPVAPNDTEENMARNRRVEIIVLED